MAKAENQKTEETQEARKAPKGVTIDQTIALRGQKISYQAHADWVILRSKEDEANAEMFHVAYLKKDSDAKSRPVTFVFNGGPGASAAYLHMGALGPQRVHFNDDGTLAPPPVEIFENQECWLSFTDLVFIDPIGTGFSRWTGPEKKDDKDKEKSGDKKEYWAMNKDLDSLGQFIQNFLTQHKRWTSPCYVAGESYGGFRVAKLSKKLQADFGIGLNGAILISPCFDWSVLAPNDYDVQAWVNYFPTLVATAHHHGRYRYASGHSLEQALEAAEEFAVNEMACFLTQGDRMSEESRQSVFRKYAEMTGLEADYVALKSARIGIGVFVRKLLEDERKVMGLYDSTLTLVDPFPDRETNQAPDTTLGASERIFCSGVNSQLRERFGLDVQRDYRLLSKEVNMSWKNDAQSHAFDLKVDSADDLRYALSLNPFLKVFITHGYHDLVTPYFSADRLVGQMRLTSEQRERVVLKHFGGGHMFYTWRKSREDFYEAMEGFYS